MTPIFRIKEIGINFDNAATTQVDDDVVDTMMDCLQSFDGNSETNYSRGLDAKQALEDARFSFSDILKCRKDQIVFTSGGTESNNLAVLGCSGKGVVVGAIEHKSVLAPAMSRNHVVLPVDKYGMYDLNFLEDTLKTGSYSLVSVQYANNEIGTIQPVCDVSSLCHKYGVLFHCDAVQAFGKIRFDIDDIGADLMTFSAHKFHGPKGIGVLYVADKSVLKPLLLGGQQEFGVRPGTVPVYLAVALAKAADTAVRNIPTVMPMLRSYTDWIATQMASGMGAIKNGHALWRIPNLVSVTIPSVDALLVCSILDSVYGISISSGSACSSGSRKSHVLEALGRPNDFSSTFRFSLSKYNTREELVTAYSCFQAAIAESNRRSV